MENMFKHKKVLITGHLGMIGKELTLLLEELEAFVVGADIKNGIDLRQYSNCLRVTENIDYAFLLMGVKGSPKMTQERPVDFFVPMIQCNTNTLEACRINEVKKVVYTSSIAVLNPQTDRFPAAAKSLAELQIEAYRVQYPEFGQNCFITRPANVYGRFDNFDNPNAMVVTSLVRKSILNDEIEVWGDGSETREFISARDVAKGMLLTMIKSPNKPVNLGSGEIHSIKEVADILSNLSGKPIKYLVSEKKGDKNRVVYNDPNQSDVGFKPKDNFKESIEEVYNSAKNYYLYR
jgi:nucleoside-diphosphate-sugar epimerase